MISEAYDREKLRKIILIQTHARIFVDKIRKINEIKNANAILI